MAEGRAKIHWNHTSAILAMLANVQRDPKKSKALKPSDFHPHLERPVERIPACPNSFKILKAVFVRPDP